MTRITDGKSTFEIVMRENDGADISADFFEVGGLRWNDEDDTYQVDDAEYCVGQATDWKYFRGDYADDELKETNERKVIVYIR